MVKYKLMIIWCFTLKRKIILTHEPLFICCWLHFSIFALRPRVKVKSLRVWAVTCCSCSYKATLSGLFRAINTISVWNSTASVCFQLTVCLLSARPWPSVSRLRVMDRRWPAYKLWVKCTDREWHAIIRDGSMSALKACWCENAVARGPSTSLWS